MVAFAEREGKKAGLEGLPEVLHADTVHEAGLTK
jgi:hypothetical protein